MFKHKSLAPFATYILLVTILLIAPQLFAESRHNHREDRQQWNQPRNSPPPESTTQQIESNNPQKSDIKQPYKKPQSSNSQRYVQPRSKDRPSNSTEKANNRSHTRDTQQSERKPSKQQVPRHESGSTKTWSQHDKTHKGNKGDKKQSLPASKKPESKLYRYPKSQQSDHKYNRKQPANNFANEYLHKHKYRPNHHLYKRHKYVYFNTPWYNTWYLAPIHRHYHRHGYHVKVLPRSYVRIVVYGYPYFYYSGMYYRSFDSGYIVVAAPLDAAIMELPVGFIAFSIGNSEYYFVNDTYYIWRDTQQAYIVVAKPAGADEAMQVATAGRLYIYPQKDQDENQQAKDRYECHRWAVTETGVDPSLEEQQFDLQDKNEYKRAISACLEGRDYSVQ